MRSSVISLTCLLSLPLLLSACPGGGGDEGTDADTETSGDGDGDQGDGDGDQGDGDGDQGDGDGDQGDGDGEGCTPGEIVCAEGDAQICDDSGVLTEEVCDDVCVEGIGCALCEPGSTQCSGDSIQTCNEVGSGWQNSDYCDPLQGLSCDAGTCSGACAEVTNGFLGCDYYPTITASAWISDQIEFEFGVVVANGNDEGTNVCISQGGADSCFEMGFVGPNTVVTYSLDDIPELKNGPLTNMPEPSVLVEGGAYRIRTDLPVAVYQINPLNQVYASADASLLLPARAWDTEYVVVSRNHWVFGGGINEVPGFYAVIGRETNTQVSISPSSTGVWVAEGGGVNSDGTGDISLNRGDVLQVFTWRENGLDYSEVIPSDLTGTRIVADQPVQVIGGSKCTNVPFDVSACDRLEDAIVPLSLASDTYVVSAPVQPGTDGMADARRMVRIVATEDDTGISYNPAIPGAPTSIQYAGDYVEFDATESFTINASTKVLVAEYMTGASFGGGGDPSMALAVPVNGFLDEYLIYAPTNFNENWINVVFDKDSVIELDGDTIIDESGSEQLGVSDWRVQRVALSNEGDGTHTLVAQEGSEPFGLSVYGYGGAVSYWYPGGINVPSQ